MSSNKIVIYEQVEETQSDHCLNNFNNFRHNSEYQNKCNKTVKKLINKRSSSVSCSPESMKIYARKLSIMQNSPNSSDQEDEDKNDLMEVRCFICGLILNVGEFEDHYLSCKSHYNQKNSVSNKKLIEPKNIGEFMSKIVMECVCIEDVEDYNQQAEKIFWEVMCKSCENCGKKFKRETYETHIRGCFPGYQNKISSGSSLNISQLSKLNSQIININSNLLNNVPNNESNEMTKPKSYKYNKITFKEFCNKFNLIKNQKLAAQKKPVRIINTKYVKLRKKSVDDIMKNDIQQIRSSVKKYFI